MNIAQILVKEPFEYRKLLQQNLRTGMSFPAARSSALIRYMREKATSVHNTFGVSSEHIELILSSPNNILGIEYCKALLRLNSRILPHALLEREVVIMIRIFLFFPTKNFPLLPASGAL